VGGALLDSDRTAPVWAATYRKTDGRRNNDPIVEVPARGVQVLVLLRKGMKMSAGIGFVDGVP